MSRTTLCLLTAGGLALLALGTMACRYHVLGDEVRLPVGPSWKITLTVKGQSTGRARLWTAIPADLGRHHLITDTYESDDLSYRPPDARFPERRRVVWSQRGGGAAGPIQARAEFLVGLKLSPGRRDARPAEGLYAPPRPGDYLADEPLIEAGHDRISEQARALTAGLTGSTSQLDTAQALFRLVEQKVRTSARHDGPPAGALTCLEKGSGDRCAKARLLVALLRNRNIPARVVNGLALSKAPEQQPHYWVEAFVYDHWLPMCPTYRHFGRVPSTYLVFGFGDRALVTQKRISDLKSTFLVEKVGHEADAAEGPFWRRAFKSVSLYQLPPGDRRLVEVLLLLPVAALLVCAFRNVVGMNSFGTFAPALVGLAFHDLHSWPGVAVFVGLLLAGWGMRRALDRYHLLQVPRVALMLSLILSVVVVVIVTSNLYGAPATRYISLFPMVILTGMVERFWTLEAEDGTAASFRTLAQTLVMALAIAAVLGQPWLKRLLFCYPEALGLVMACQLLIGRYTGYRLTELWRFRDFLRPPAPPVGYTTT